MTIKPDSDGPRTLVVDDHSISSHHAVTVLRQCPGTVRRVNTAEEGLNEVFSWFPDVICMDLHLPDLDGLHTIQRIRSGWPVDKPPPRVILLTGDDSALNQHTLSALNIERLLLKPVSGLELREAVHFPENGEIKEPRPGDHEKGMLDLFRSELDQRLPELDRCIREIDLRGVSDILHQLIASAAITGQTRLEASFRALDSQCRQGASTTAVASSYYAVLECAHSFLYQQAPREP